MPYQADINSSDVEPSSPAPLKPKFFTTAGAKSINEIIDNAVKDRFASKKEVRALTDSRGRPRQQYQRALWKNRFLAFRTESLGGDPKGTPSAEDIERFLCSILNKVKSILDVPTYNWMRLGVSDLTAALIFEYSDFRLSAHQSLRISTLVDNFVKQGKLTKSPTRDHHWVGATLVITMIDAILRNALDNGTPNWDVTVHAALSMLLLSALHCRTGDITADRLDVHFLPFLTYGDVRLKLVGGQDLEHLEARVTIRNEKGHKDDPKRNRLVTLKPLKDPQHNHHCPVKLILVLALRLGNTNSISIEDLLAQASRRRDKAVMWSNPDRPIVAKLSLRGTHLIPDTRACIDAPGLVIARAGKLGGILARLRPHDLRYGAAYDSANLKNGATDVATPAVARSLGHSGKALYTNLTDKYAGDSHHDYWSSRVEQSIEPPKFDLTTAPAAYEPPALSTHKITQLCVQKGLEYSTRINRQRVRTVYRREHFDQWVKNGHGPEPYEQASSTPGSSSSTPSDANRRKRPHTAAVGDDHTGPPSTTTKKSRLDGPWHSDIQDDDADDASASQIDMNQAHPNDGNLDGMDDIPIDPVLLAEGNSLAAVIAGAEDQTMTEAAENAVFEQLTNTGSIQGFPEFDLSGTAFISFLASINVVRNSTYASQLASKAEAFLQAYGGNSRATPTLFLFQCKNHSKGCTFTHASYSGIEAHETRCKITSPKPDKSFLCDKCPAAYGLKADLAKHKRNKHDWVPKPCLQKTCDPDTLFANHQEYDRHYYKCHSHSAKYQPAPCSYPACDDKQIQKTYSSLSHHLITAHKLSSVQARKYLPSFQRPAFVKRSCPVSGCTHPKVWDRVDHLKRHLYSSVHRLSKDQVEALLAL